MAPYSSAASLNMEVRTVQYIGNRRAVILRNHGVVTVGPTLKDALHAAVYLEDASRSYCVAGPWERPAALLQTIWRKPWSPLPLRAGKEVMNCWPAKSFCWDIYEKALFADQTWPEKLSTAARAGYQFVQLSVDESEKRLAQLEWAFGQRRELRSALSNAPASMDTMCLSAHRKYPLGSDSKPVRERGLDIIRRAIGLAAELGIRMISGGRIRRFLRRVH